MTHYGLTIFSDDVEDATISRLMGPYNEQPETPEARAMCRVEISDEVENQNEYAAEEFAARGYMKNDAGKWCYVRYPDKKWDYYGQRGWEHFYTNGSDVKTDQLQLKNLDLARAWKEGATKLEKLWADWSYYRDNLKEPPEYEKSWSGMRGTAVGCGLLICIDENELTDEQRDMPKILWPRQLKEGVNRYDLLVGHAMAESEFRERFKFHFHPYSCWAFLDESGWNEPGRMGWFAMSDETPEQMLAFKRKLIERLTRGVESTPEAWITIVDCHI